MNLGIDLANRRLRRSAARCGRGIVLVLGDRLEELVDLFLLRLDDTLEVLVLLDDRSAAVAGQVGPGRVGFGQPSATVVLRGLCARPAGVAPDRDVGEDCPQEQAPVEGVRGLGRSVGELGEGQPWFD
jgi:hypothetical protein